MKKGEANGGRDTAGLCGTCEDPVIIFAKLILFSSLYCMRLILQSFLVIPPCKGIGMVPLKAHMLQFKIARGQVCRSLQKIDGG